MIPSEADRAVGRHGRGQSQVLLKNTGNVLPPSPTAKVYVAGRNAGATRRSAR